MGGGGGIWVIKVKTGPKEGNEDSISIKHTKIISKNMISGALQTRLYISSDENRKNKNECSNEDLSWTCEWKQ